jgi:hypothetical protein
VAVIARCITTISNLWLINTGLIYMANGSENNFHIPFKQLESKFRSVIPRLSLVAGNEALNFVLDNFRMQGFMGSSFMPWKQRKNPTKWGMKPKNNGRAIEVLTGRYRRSWRITNLSTYTVVIGSDVPYAKAQNEGLRLGLIQHVRSYERNKYSSEKKGTGTFSIKTRKENQKTISYVSGTATVKAHDRKINQNIPARPVIGKSPYLDRKLLRAVTLEIVKELRPFKITF